MKPTIYVQCLSHYNTLIIHEFSVEFGGYSIYNDLIIIAE